jgi:hypothetical protein
MLWFCLGGKAAQRVMREEDGKMMKGEERRKREREGEGKSGSLAIGDELVHATTVASCRAMTSSAVAAADCWATTSSPMPAASQRIYIYIFCANCWLMTSSVRYGSCTLLDDDLTTNGNKEGLLNNALVFNQILCSCLNSLVMP